MPIVTLRNIIPNPSFEFDTNWSGAVYNTEEKLIGSRSIKLADTTIVTTPVETPILGHKYYGREYIKSSGDIGAADYRFEWWGGDGYGLNFVFATNNGNFPAWTMQSSIVQIDALNASSFIIRDFVVSAKNPCWIDGLIIVDLTEAFGSGKEPSKEWCDRNIPFFTNTTTLDVMEVSDIEILNAEFTPNPVVINTSLTISIGVKEVYELLLPFKLYSGDLYSGEV